MKFSRPHIWTDDVREAERIQDKYRSEVITKPEKTSFRLVGGVDVAYSKKDNSAFAVVVVMKVPEMELIERVRSQGEVTFPFVPGLFFFREGPTIFKALSRLKFVPDCFIFDGHGIDHPKGIGMASQMGIMLEMPTIGCAKKLLCGTAEPVDNNVGDRRQFTTAMSRSDAQSDHVRVSSRSMSRRVIRWMSRRRLRP